MIQKLGILSDTHLSTPGTAFVSAVDQVFRDSDLIIHAGDLTDTSILSAFVGKPVVAVHGNTCSPTTRARLPESRLIQVGGRTIAVCHGHAGGPGLEDYLLGRFGDADCIVFGHTHRPLIKQIGQILLVNPGTFRATGQYGSPGTYAVLDITNSGMHAEICEVPLTL